MQVFINNTDQIDSQLKMLGDMLRHAMSRGAKFEVSATIQKGQPRTTTQNNALHLYRRRLAAALNDAGQDRIKIQCRNEQIPIPWTEESVKTELWDVMQKAMFDVDSSTRLTKLQVSEVYEALNRAIAQVAGVSVPFPNKGEVVGYGG